MQSILLHIHEDEGMEARLDIALSLVGQFDAHLDCLQCPSGDFTMPGDFYSAMSAEMAMEYANKAPQVKEAFERRLKAANVRWSWFHATLPADIEITRHAPMSDLIVMGGHNFHEPFREPSRLVGGLVLRVRPPILVVPDATPNGFLNTPMTIAWNGSAEAAHALRAAMPILAQAEQVHILTVVEEKNDDRFDLPPINAAEYLARHDIEAEIVELPRGADHSIAQVLVDGSKARNAGMLVMGAYGHSRFWETLFGGVTRDILADPQIPLLLSH